MVRKIALTGLLAGSLMACSQTKSFDLPETSNDFVQDVKYNNKVDVIFIMDNSSSMAIANQKLRDTIPGLVQALLKQKLDLHVAVITTSIGGKADGGRFLGSPAYLTSSTPDMANVLISRLKSVGDDGSDLERGLDSLAAVLAPSYLAGEGRGFLRNDALMAIIALSTEDDKSSNVSGGANGYAGILDSVKGFYEDGTRQWILNFIGVLSLSSGNCPAAGSALGYLEPGLRYMNLANLTGGVQASVCAADLSLAATNIRARISQILTDFPLDKKPDEATIVVKVNGVVVPRSNVNGWDYVADKNLIRFYGSAIPAADASINVDFKPAAAN